MNFHIFFLKSFYVKWIFPILTLHFLLFVYILFYQIILNGENLEIAYNNPLVML